MQYAFLNKKLCVDFQILRTLLFMCLVVKGFAGHLKLFLPIFKPKFKKFFVFFHTAAHHYYYYTTTARIFKDLLFRVFREILLM